MEPEIQFAWPPTPDVSAAVLARIEDRPRRRWLILPILLALLVPAATATAISEDLQRWLGLRSAKVTVGDPPPAVPTPAPQEPVSLAEAEEIAGFAPILPPALGTPDTVTARSTEIVLHYGDLRLYEIRGAFERELIQKIIETRDDVRAVPGGAFFPTPHFFLYLRPDGAIREGRTAQATLVVERGDLLLRLEGRGLTLPEARRLLAE